jgi:large subunit ribosomal protein L1
MGLTKNQKAALQKYNPTQEYSLSEAAVLVKEITTTKFDASVDVDVRLGVDPRKADQMVRGVTSLPHGTGRELKVLVLCTPDKEQEAKDAGADYAGLDEYITKIKGGWLEIDVTVTMDVANAVKEIKAGKIDFKVDKYGIIHTSVGRASFSSEQILENITELMVTLSKLKPAAAKGTYIKSVSVSSTMSKGIKIEKSSIPGL